MCKCHAHTHVIMELSKHLKPEILLSFIYTLAKKSPGLSTKSHDVWSPPGELSEQFYIFLLYQYSLSQFLISFVS